MKYLAAFYLLLLLSISQCFAQAGAKATAMPIQKTELALLPASTKESTSLMSEKDYYKMMYEQALASSSAANTLTQWTLASVAGVIILVIGGQIFFNYRLGEREISAIRADMQAQIADSQTTLLGRLSDISANNLQALESRAQAIDLRLQAAINRELDATKLSLQESISFQYSEFQDDIQRVTQQVSTVSYNNIASNIWDRGHYEAAWTTLLEAAEPRITERYIDSYTCGVIGNYLLESKEFEESIYDNIARFASILKRNAYPDYINWRERLKGKRVYKNSYDAEGKQSKEYIEKQSI